MKNILAKTEKKNRAYVLIFAIILTVSLGMLVGCSATKENTEDGTASLETEDSETVQSSNDCSIIIEDISLSIYEDKQSILAKLDESSWDYSEFELDNPEENQYDTCYNIDGWMQMYFLDDECVRLRAIDIDGSDEIVQTARGVHPGSTYSQMVDLYGDSFETHAYAGKTVYTIYRYLMNDCICEFGIQGDDSDSIYNVDIYVPSQAPIYDYGEELIN